MQAAFHQACRDAGFPDDPDMNHPDATGVGQMPLNNPGGVRMSTAITYLDACRHRLNLTIRANALARRILFDGAKATGVEVESGGETFVVEGNEIILSTGAIHSPHLLLLSGVGPADELRPHGIAPVHDLPGVGRNMKNHSSVNIVFRSHPGHHLTPDMPRNQVGLRFSADGSERNDVQVQPTTSYPSSPTPPNIRFGCRLEYPYSEGALTLASADVSAQPNLDFRFLTNPQGLVPIPGRGAPNRRHFRPPGIPWPAGGTARANRRRPRQRRRAGRLAATERGHRRAHVGHLQDGAGVGPAGRGGPALQGSRT